MDQFITISLFLIWLLYTIPSTTGQDVAVETNIGTIIGELYRGSYNATPFTVSRFLGIPFAEAPIGERRFQIPVKKAPFTEPLIAKSMPPACAQLFNPTSGVTANNLREDCLYMNVLVPGDTISANNRKAVLIWIHGGRFQYGSQEIYTSPTFAGLNDVILVTMNYRLSIYGFLSTGESHMKGNYGLWDQQMAIQWVHDHIANFGGDTNRVTIFGGSAGAISVVFQALHEGNQGLFKRVIAQSGKTTSAGVLSEGPKVDFDQIVKRTDCMVGTLPTVIKCLQNKTTEEIESAIKDISFFPVYDRDFVGVNPFEIFKNEAEQASKVPQSFGKLDFVFGVNSDEGASFIPFLDYRFMSPQVAATNPSEGYTLDMFETLAVPALLASHPNIRLNNALQRAVAHTYIEWKDTSNRIRLRQGAMKVLSDINFNADMIHASDVHSSMGETGQTFFYVYDHRLSLLPADRGFDGAAHAEEVRVVLGLDKATGSVETSFDANSNTSNYEDPATELPAHEILFSRQVMEYWTNFAKTG